MIFGNGWLKQVPLRRGPALGAPAPKPRKKLGQLSCCNAPNGQSYCFDTGSGECVMTWVSSATGTPGTPACVQDSRGQWVLPSCVGQEAQPSQGRPPLPPGCSYVGAASNSIQEVICECFNCTTRQSDGWRGLLSDFIAMGSKNPCLKTPEWFPKPAQCPNGVGGGGTYTPPAPTLPTTPLPGGGISALPAPAPGTAPSMAPQATAGAEQVPGENLLACRLQVDPPTDRFAVVDAATGALVHADMKGMDMMTQYPGIKYSDEFDDCQDPRCAPHVPRCSAAAAPPAAPPPPAQPSPTPPPAAAQPPAGTPTLPTTPINDALPQMGPLPVQTYSYEAQPTGLPYGSPYPPGPSATRALAPPPPPPAASAPIPTQPMACPVGPIKVADWSKGCVGNALRRLG